MNIENGSFSLFDSWRSVLLTYLILLLSSYLWQYLDPSQRELEPGQQSLNVYQVRGDSLLKNKSVSIAYLDLYHGAKKNPPVLLMLHGSPVGTPMYPGLIYKLADSVRVLAPDFPGYDNSGHDVPDYSIRSFAIYMKQFLDSLGVPSAHLVGYSLGGGVAINLAEMYPEKVRSVDLLAAIGVQELELMGSYHLNRAIHGAQLAAIWALHNLIPHYGLLNDFPLNIPYARSFYDSDQRPLRDYLKDYKKPMLIQHGRNDEFVPLAAAREHHRIVPQSELKIYDSGHALVIHKQLKVTRDILYFVNKVENDSAVTYSEASPERIRKAKEPFDTTDFNKAEGITLFVLLLIIVLSTLISEDLTCIGAGLMAARGIIGFFPAVTACFIGIMIGDIGLFILGKLLGKPAVRKAPIRWFISDSDLKQSAEWFKSKGPAIIIASRFIPGSRFPTYFSAGVIGSNVWVFLFYFIGAAIVWTPLLVGISMFVGNELIRYFEAYKNYAIWVLLGTIAVLYILFKLVFPLFTWKGRRLVLSRWRRLTRWEFWPPYLIYGPLTGYLLWLMFRYKGVTTFTAANPSIPDGGFVGESKSDILELFKSSGNVAKFTCLSYQLGTGEQFRQAVSFIEEQEIDFPVVVKPDVGERGKDVYFPKNKKELQNCIESIEKDLILQQYVPGKEFGVFYYRYPGDENGSIFSITDKRFIKLQGDGKHTLEELILKDDRAVCMAKYHFNHFKDRLYWVPDKGEEVKLVKLGTHARGAVFLDGSQFITKSLQRSIDEISKQAEGFYFGRYDIRVPSEDDLIAGKKIAILEVNGVTSESTNIYDPDKSYFEAVKILGTQWKIAYKVGYLNRKEGANTSRLVSLIKKLVTFLSH